MNVWGEESWLDVACKLSLVVALLALVALVVALLAFPERFQEHKVEAVVEVAE